MPIEWSSRPVAKAEIPRGTPWSYTLPLRDTGTAVRWHCRALPPSTWEADPACPGRITILVPDDLDILFGELTWSVTVEGAEPATGRIVFRVIEVRRESRPRATAVPGSPVTEPATPVVASPAPASPPPADEPSPPSAAATRFIEVIRDGVTIAGLRAEVRSARTVTIGRGSTLEAHDLDLAGRFETHELETVLSRRQAEVFCNDEGVFIRNVGTRPMKLVDPSGTPCGDVPPDHPWSVGEVIALPGKLRIVLREQ